MQKMSQLDNPAAATLPALAVLAFLFLLASRRQQPSLDAYDSAAAFPSPASVRPSPQGGSAAAAAARVPNGCDIFRGEWVPDDGAGPYYTNLTCTHIHEHQNCMKYGRPDRGFLRWRWRPAGCEMPRFDAGAFLDVVRGRSMAFIGDSIARNHMQSLMCLLSKVENPKDISTTTDQKFKTLHYESYNFTLAVFWSPFLVRGNQSESGMYNIFLDELDEAWTAEFAVFDYVILSADIWFNKPSVFYEAGRVTGCSHCSLPGVPDLTRRYSLQMALRVALRVVTAAEGFSGTLILRTVSPTSHFEGGEWNKGGDCRRTRPFAANETRMAGLDLDFHTAQVEEFARAKAEAAAGGSSARLLLMDTTPAMLLRPDGHPSRYGHWPHVNLTMYNDCVHWCLPGPIDAWNEMLLQVMLLPDRF